MWDVLIGAQYGKLDVPMQTDTHTSHLRMRRCKCESNSREATRIELRKNPQDVGLSKDVLDPKR